MVESRPTGRECRQQVSQAPTAAQADEVLVPDSRNDQTPRQVVEAKLQFLLGKALRLSPPLGLTRPAFSQYDPRPDLSLVEGEADQASQPR
jgi:hypothetical protein